MTEILDKIQTLKEGKNAVILAHNYQPGPIPDMADFVGSVTASFTQDDGFPLAKSQDRNEEKVEVVIKTG